MPMSRIMGEIQIVKMEAGVEKDAISADDYSTVNLIGNSLFRQMEVYLNDCQLMDLSSSLYGYKSIIETILSYGKEAKSTHLISSGYYDESGKETINVQAGGDNTSGYVRRKAHVKNSKRFSFVSQLHCDFLSW